LSLIAIWIAVLSAVASAQDWKPVDPAHLAMKSPVVEKEADAEAILWEVRVADEVRNREFHTVLSHYLRIKIFTDRGGETQSKIDIPYFNRTGISDIDARTIKPDGSIIQLKKDDVFERTIIRAGGLKIKAKSFALPAVEPGAIVEYKWKETRYDALANYIRLQLQRDIPVQLVRYFIKPLPNSRYTMRLMAFHAQTTPFTKEPDGYNSTTMANVPAFHEEPFMLPESEVRAWMLVYYTENSDPNPDQYWPAYAKETYEEFKSSMQASDEVRRTTVSVIGDASTPDEKLRRIYEFCKSRIRNTDNEASGLSSEQKAQAKLNKMPADTLKHEIGTGFQVNMLFAALASAAGFEARIARTPDRGDMLFDPRIVDKYFLRRYAVAVRVGNDWRFFDPKSTYVPYGMLGWQQEGTTTLICDPKNASFVRTPVSSRQASMAKRTARLRLSEDGTIEGQVRLEYTGHLAVSQKEANEADSPAEREKTLIKSLRERMSTAELSNIKIENATDPIKAFVYDYHVRVPEYAQRTGKRLLLQPGFFHHGESALFPSSARRYPVYFHYPWSEEDTVEIALPAGFEVEEAEDPNGIRSDIVEYEMKIAATDGRVLRCGRVFSFGRQDVTTFSAPNYTSLKNLFDTIHLRDNQTITLKQTGSN
jgi:hypothetical protein